LLLKDSEARILKTLSLGAILPGLIKPFKKEKGMYAKILQKWSAASNGVFQRNGRSVHALLESADGTPLLVFGVEDMPDSGVDAHIARLFVQVLPVPEGSQDVRRQEYQAQLERNPYPDLGRCYYLSGGRELRSLLDCRPWVSKGRVMRTSWLALEADRFDRYASSADVVERYAGENETNLRSENLPSVVSAYLNTEAEQSVDTSAVSKYLNPGD